MVTTFSARLLHIANRCSPIVGQKRKHSHSSDTPGANANSTTGRSMKRSSGYYYADMRSRNDNASDAQSNKRRRQKEELQYTAATIQKALSNAGRTPMSVMSRNRRERALPFGSVDMQSVKVVTSAEFDNLDYMNDNEEEQDGDVHQGEAGQHQHEEESSGSNYDSEDYDVSSMYMLSGLIQSTRHYYSFVSDDTAATNAEASPSASMIAASDVQLSNDRLSSQETSANLTQVYKNYNDEKLSEDNSEGLSSWTPSCRSYNDLMNENDRKDIDNDNRSDGQSSDMGSAEGSISSFGSPPRDQRPDNDGVGIRKESNARNDAPFSIVG